MTKPDREIPLADAAHRLGLSWGQAWRFLLQGKLEGRKVGGRWMVTRTSVVRLAGALGTQRRKAQ